MHYSLTCCSLSGTLVIFIKFNLDWCGRILECKWMFAVIQGDICCYLVCYNYCQVTWISFFIKCCRETEIVSIKGQRLMLDIFLSVAVNFLKGSFITVVYIWSLYYLCYFCLHNGLFYMHCTFKFIVHENETQQNSSKFIFFSKEFWRVQNFPK